MPDEPERTEAAQATRQERVQGILKDAEMRDEQADDRDSVADGRDKAASLDSFLNDDERNHSAALTARRAGALDRHDAKDDRAAAAEDRSQLAESDE